MNATERDYLENVSDAEILRRRVGLCPKGCGPCDEGAVASCVRCHSTTFRDTGAMFDAVWAEWIAKRA